MPAVTLNEGFRRAKARLWRIRGRIPHAYGYNAARWLAIERDVRSGNVKYGWDGAGFDERVVEYPWIFDRMRELRAGAARALDAGSVMNHARVLGWWREAGNPPLSIVTLAPEPRAIVSDLARYEFADLRELPYRDEWFSVVICSSTIEHVGMDNTVYGAGSQRVPDPGAEALRALAEIRRVTTSDGVLLLSVPFGAKSDRGWFRILDGPELNRLANAPGWRTVAMRFFRSLREGWRECGPAEASGAGYNDPSADGAARTAPDWVAGAEAVALVEMRRA